MSKLELRVELVDYRIKIPSNLETGMLAPVSTCVLYKMWFLG